MAAGRIIQSGGPNATRGFGEVNAKKTKYMARSCEQNAGQNY